MFNIKCVQNTNVFSISEETLNDIFNWFLCLFSFITFVLFTSEIEARSHETHSTGATRLPANNNTSGSRPSKYTPSVSPHSMSTTTTPLVISRTHLDFSTRQVHKQITSTLLTSSQTQDRTLQTLPTSHSTRVPVYTTTTRPRVTSNTPAYTTWPGQQATPGLRFTDRSNTTSAPTLIPSSSEPYKTTMSTHSVTKSPDLDTTTVQTTANRMRGNSTNPKMGVLIIGWCVESKL